MNARSFALNAWIAIWRWAVQFALTALLLLAGAPAAAQPSSLDVLPSNPTDQDPLQLRVFGGECAATAPIYSVQVNGNVVAVVHVLPDEGWTATPPCFERHTIAPLPPGRYRIEWIESVRGQTHFIAATDIFVVASALAIPVPTLRGGMLGILIIMVLILGSRDARRDSTVSIERAAC